MRLSLFKASFLIWILPIVFLLPIGIFIGIFAKSIPIYFLIPVSICFILALIVLSTGLYLSIKKRLKFLNSVITTLGKFIFYYDVRNPLFLIVWVKRNEDWFLGMVKEVIDYLGTKKIRVREEDIKKPIYIQFKDTETVGYYDKRGEWVRCSGFQRKGYIELEWSIDFPDEYIKNVLRHEIMHFLIDLVRPGLSEKTHHDIMDFQG